LERGHNSKGPSTTAFFLFGRPQLGITFANFKDTLINFGLEMTDAEFRKAFSFYDTDGNGTIEFDEFVQRVMPEDYPGQNVDTIPQISWWRAKDQVKSHRVALDQEIPNVTLNLGSRQGRSRSGSRSQTDFLRMGGENNSGTSSRDYIDRKRPSTGMIHTTLIFTSGHMLLLLGSQYIFEIVVGLHRHYRNRNFILLLLSAIFFGRNPLNMFPNERRIWHEEQQRQPGQEYVNGTMFLAAGGGVMRVVCVVLLFLTHGK
jgi:hypothetical protein